MGRIRHQRWEWNTVVRIIGNMWLIRSRIVLFKRHCRKVCRRAAVVFMDNGLKPDGTDRCQNGDDPDL